MASTWISYNELAWTENILATPEAYEAEAAVYVELLQRQAAEIPRTLLHLGCGAGGYDRLFKRHFTVTGVDLSAGMLEIARSVHPEIDYLEDDMRTVRLNRQFDAVAIPDSIDYMATREDLEKAVQTAAVHLKLGGVLLVVGKTQETFQNNNFAYSGEKNRVHVTLLENNYINPFRLHTYEATFVYLIRRDGELSTYLDHTVLGLFPLAVWEQVFGEAGLVMERMTLDGIYDDYLLNEGEYPLTVFIGQKR